MLVVENLSKSYVLKDKKFYANRNINFSISNGKMIWIYGNSGSGKSTLLNMLSGLDIADEGAIKWDGIDIIKLSNNQKADFRLRNMGLIFQFFEMIKTQSVYSNVSIPLKLLNVRKEKIDDDVFSILRKFNIENIASKKPKFLSGGEKQRVAISRALISSPKIIIADEITASLDTEMSIHVYKELKKYIVEHNGIGIFVSHDPLIKDFADEIYVMKNGSLIKEKYVNN